MKRLMILATGIAAGAFAMYMLDPVAGRRRRAQVREKAVATGHDAERLARGASKHTVDRFRGAAAEVRSRFRTERVGDRRLHERIRSQLGRLVAAPGHLEVGVDNGHVTLRGSARPSEVEPLVAAVSGMQGVESVDNRLETGPRSQDGQPVH